MILIAVKAESATVDSELVVTEEDEPIPIYEDTVVYD